MSNKNKYPKPGEVTTLWIRIKKERAPIEYYPIRMRLIKYYKHFALFKSAAGIRECWSYWELKRILQKPKKGE